MSRRCDAVKDNEGRASVGLLDYETDHALKAEWRDSGDSAHIVIEVGLDICYRNAAWSGTEPVAFLVA